MFPGLKGKAVHIPPKPLFTGTGQLLFYFSNSQGYTPVNQNCGHSRLQTAGRGRTWLSIIPFSITTFSCIFPHCRIVPQQSEPEHDKFYFMSPKALRQRTQTKHLHQLQYTHSLTSLTIFFFFKPQQICSTSKSIKQRKARQAATKHHLFKKDQLKLFAAPQQIPACCFPWLLCCKMTEVEQDAETEGPAFITLLSARGTWACNSYHTFVQ